MPFTIIEIVAGCFDLAFIRSLVMDDTKCGDDVGCVERLIWLVGLHYLNFRCRKE